MEKKLRLKDLAADLGVSAATVSRALNDSYEISEQLKKEIRNYAACRGYQPDRTAASLRKGTSGTIGLVVPSLAYYFNTYLIEGLEKTMIPKGYKVLIFQTMESYEREREAVEYLLSIKVDGIVASIGAATREYGHFELVRKQKKPLVLVDRTTNEIEASQIVIDHESGSYQAVKHLLDMGCRHIAWIPGIKGLHLSAMRQRGYEKALQEYGLPFDDRLIAYCDFHSDMGFQTTRDLLLKHPEIDGIYAINDRIAMGVMGAVHSLQKRIPEDIAVVGFNNEPYDTLLNPALSSVYQPARQMGVEAGRLMLRHLKSRHFIPEKKVLGTRLIVRASSTRGHLVHG